LGGKSKLFNPDKLKAIYYASKHFDIKANECLQNIQKALNTISHPEYLRQMADQQGIAAKLQVSMISDAMKDMKDKLHDTSHFIERRLDASSMTHDPISALPQSQSRKVPMDKNLKK